MILELSVGYDQNKTSAGACWTPSLELQASTSSKPWWMRRVHGKGMSAHGNGVMNSASVFNEKSPPQAEAQIASYWPEWNDENDPARSARLCSELPSHETSHGPINQPLLRAKNSIHISLILWCPRSTYRRLRLVGARNYMREAHS